MVKNDVMRAHRDVCGGCERASHATAGGPGGFPREIICKYKLWEGHFKANLKAPGEKKG